jgi:O-antigen ligase
VTERLVPIFVTGLLLLGIPLAMESLLFAVIIGAAAALVLVLGMLGLHRASVFLLVAAYALAPLTKFTVPGFRFFNISDVLFLVAFALALPRLMTRRIWLPLPFVIGSMFFVTIAVLASAQSASPGESFYTAARVIITFIGFPVLLVWWSPRGKVLVALVLAFAAGTILSVLVGIPQMGGWRNFGLTGHPNVLGYTAMLTVALLPFLTKVLPSPQRAWICGAIFGVAGLGVWTSGSRAALVTTLVLVVLFPAAERSVLAAFTVLASGVVALLVVVGGRNPTDAPGQDALSRLLGEGNVEGSNQVREKGVEFIWNLAVQHPFLGSGFLVDEFLGHNSYLQIAAAAGFISLAAFLLVCVSMVTPLFVHDNVHSRLVYPMIAFLVAAPVSPNLTDRYTGFLFGLAMVGVVAVHEARLGAQQEDSVEGPAPPARGLTSARSR